jgi:hypothetical protein
MMTGRPAGDAHWQVRNYEADGLRKSAQKATKMRRAIHKTACKSANEDRKTNCCTHAVANSMQDTHRLLAFSAGPIQERLTGTWPTHYHRIRSMSRWLRVQRHTECSLTLFILLCLTERLSPLLHFPLIVDFASSHCQKHSTASPVTPLQQCH